VTLAQNGTGLTRSRCPVRARCDPCGVAWPLLVVAGLLEIVWALLLKQSEGFSKLWPSVGFFVAGTGSIVGLALALKDLPVGTAYAVWTGIGAVGTAGFGMLLLDESTAPGRLASIGLVVFGVLGLRIFGGE
jgi:quaternary ammonium compound-resistance protein SugE